MKHARSAGCCVFIAWFFSAGLFAAKIGDSAEVKTYDRGAWPHWIDEDHDCQNTRQEVLIRMSRIPVTTNRSGCRVLTGEWLCPFSGKVFTDASDLDIDHLVPLKEAYLSGGDTWPIDKRQQYANDEISPGHLVAVDKRLNRAKGAQDPAKWRPPNYGAWCWYAQSWMRVKRAYDLVLDAAEVDALIEMLQACPTLEGEKLRIIPGFRA